MAGYRPRARFPLRGRSQRLVRPAARRRRAAPSTVQTTLVVSDLTSAATLDNVALTQTHQLTTADLTSATTLSNIVFPPDVKYPASKTGRKWLDQFGNPIQIRTISSWGMLQRLSTTDMTTALEAAAGRGFNAVTVDFMCGMNNVGTGVGWTSPRQNFTTGNAVWTGTAFQSTLGTLWSVEIPHLMNETARLGMYVIASCYAGNGGQTTTKGDMVAASTAQMRTSGQRWATALASWDHWVIHYGLDDSTGPDSKFDALVQGIQDNHGAILCVGEPNQGAEALTQWAGAFTNADMEEAMYDYGASSVTQWEGVYSTDPRTPDGPVWDCEPLYVGHSNGGSERLEKRYRHYTVPIEGGIGINNGHEDWWTYGASGVGFTAGDTWQTAMDNTIIQDLQRGWPIWDLVNTTGWDATSSFITTGEGTTTSKAAQGTDGTRAVAYFPDNRTVVVDTTILTGTNNVSLYWYDPTTGSTTSIAANEAQQTGRSVTLPAAHGDGTRDFVLVAELIPTLVIDNLTSAATLDNLTLTQVHQLTTQDLTSAATIDNVALGVNLLVNDLTSASTLDAPTLTQVHILTVQDLTSAATIDNVVLNFGATLVINDLVSATALDSLTLTQVHQLAIQDLSSAATLDAAPLTQVHILTVADLTSAASLDNVVLTQVHNLTIADLISASTLDDPLLGFGLIVGDLVSATTLDSVIFAAGTTLVIDDLVSAAVLDAANLTQNHVLVIADLTSAGTLSNITFITGVIVGHMTGDWVRL